MAGDDALFSGCQTTAEVVSVVNALFGAEAAATLIRDAGLPKHMLLAAADELHDVELDELARLCRKAARRAPERKRLGRWKSLTT